MATTYRFRGSKPGRTPQETGPPRGATERPLEELFLIGGERRINRFLHCHDSTTKRRAIQCRAVRLVRQGLVRDVQRGHDRDALVADDLAGVARLAQLAVEILRARLQLALLAVGARDAKLASEDVERDCALLACFRFGRHVSVSGICVSNASMRDFAAASFSARRARASVTVASCWRRSRFSERSVRIRCPRHERSSSRASSSGSIRQPYWKTCGQSMDNMLF